MSKYAGSQTADGIPVGVGAAVERAVESVRGFCLSATRLPRQLWDSAGDAMSRVVSWNRSPDGPGGVEAPEIPSRARAETLPRTQRRPSGSLLPVPVNREPQLPTQPRLKVAMRSYCESVLQHLRQGEGDTGAVPQTVGLTSCYAGEGVTTFAWQLALTAASNGRKVLLVDAHFDAPALHQVFDTDLQPGLSEWLQHSRSTTRQIGVPNGTLMLVTAGAPLAANCESYVERMREFLHYAAENFDFAFVDLPPLSGRADALPLTELLDGVLLLVQAERVRRPVAKRCVTQLVRSGAKPLGAVLNKRRQYIPRWVYRTL